MRRLPRLVVTLVTFISLLSIAAKASDWITHSRESASVPLLAPQSVPSIHFSDSDHAVVSLAANLLADDFERVSNLRPKLNETSSAGLRIYVSTIARSTSLPVFDSLSELGLEALEGTWESFIIATFPDPSAPLATSLAIIGSDPRGTAYGVFELSKAIGVSPWYWWADVPPKQTRELYIRSGTRRFGPPSVKYRGIFINDEDWGLHPWAAHTFDPQRGDIGPKTYKKVFELLLRLKANTLWPAMHEVTKAFNLYPENKHIADQYAIVMASSHAEPMLRNNVTEWTYPKSQFNYATHPQRVSDYWKERLLTNASFENIYTLGMRGIHDSGMQGAATMQEKVDALERIITDQRTLLAENVNRDLPSIPQAFTPYKEVLDIYRAGLKVPDDVTFIWPDDNHGYIRYLPNESERQRPGGSGVYYHLSYLGSPMAYLWLSTTPPALVWEEMNKAYTLGARQIWIANVGDIKPAERDTEFFLQMAWDIDQWNLDTLPHFLETWASREFGPKLAPEIASLLQRYYQLNYERRPEHLQWWLPHTKAQSSPYTGPETEQRLQAFASLIKEEDSIASNFPPDAQDAFFQLVAYPVKASAYANLRYFHIEQNSRLFNSDPDSAQQHAARARYANGQIEALTTHYNTGISGGKWNRIMAAEPADAMWRSYRISPLPLPAATMAAPLPADPLNLSELAFAPQDSDNSPTSIMIEAEAFSERKALGESRWEVIPGLGRGAGSVSSYPLLATNPLSEQNAPSLTYSFTIEQAGDYLVNLLVIPSFPLPGYDSHEVHVSLDNKPPFLLTKRPALNSNEWKQSVLSHQLSIPATKTVFLNQGEHTITLYRGTPGVVIDQIQIKRSTALQN